jgi:hypothetical protein
MGLGGKRPVKSDGQLLAEEYLREATKPPVALAAMTADVAMEEFPMVVKRAMIRANRFVDRRADIKVIQGLVQYKVNTGASDAGKIAAGFLAVRDLDPKVVDTTKVAKLVIEEQEKVKKATLAKLATKGLPSKEPIISEKSSDVLKAPSVTKGLPSKEPIISEKSSDVLKAPSVTKGLPSKEPIITDPEMSYINAIASLNRQRKDLAAQLELVSKATSDVLSEVAKLIEERNRPTSKAKTLSEAAITEKTSDVLKASSVNKGDLSKEAVIAEEISDTSKVTVAPKNKPMNQTAEKVLAFTQFRLNAKVIKTGNVADDISLFIIAPLNKEEMGNLPQGRRTSKTIHPLVEPHAINILISSLSVIHRVIGAADNTTTNILMPVRSLSIGSQVEDLILLNILLPTAVANNIRGEQKKKTATKDDDTLSRKVFVSHKKNIEMVDGVLGVVKSKVMNMIASVSAGDPEIGPDYPITAGDLSSLVTKDEITVLTDNMYAVSIFAGLRSKIIKNE